MQNSDATLDVVASLLTAEEDTPLRLRFAREFGPSASVSAAQFSYLLQSEFVVAAEVAEGFTPQQVLAVLDDELERFLQSRPTPIEVELVRRQILRSHTGGVASHLTRAARLSEFSVYTQGDPGLTNLNFSRYLSITPAIVQRTARRWLDRSHRLTVLVQRYTNGNAFVQYQEGR